MISLFIVTNCTRKHDSVNLGLTSGTLWATCNVGANTPTAYGDYFAWGETAPKSVYDITSYKYAVGEDQYVKYCDNEKYGHNGFTDNLKNLLPEDDAATVNWGKQWKTPTSEQWGELMRECTWTWQSNGYDVVGPNGNSIFLPAAGDFTNDSKNTEAGSIGIYWSSSFTSDCIVPFAYGVVFTKNSQSPSYEGRQFGFSVRPVRVTK